MPSPSRHAHDRPHSGSPTHRSRAPITMMRHRGSPSRIWMVPTRTLSEKERAGGHLRDAALRGDLVATRRWLDVGDVNSHDADGTTALHKACQYGRMEIVQTLCAAGADPNATGLSGRTPLHEACQFGAEMCVRDLLLAGAMQLPDHAGLTPGEWADRNGHAGVVSMIGNAPTVPEQVTPRGSRPRTLEPQPEPASTGKVSSREMHLNPADSPGASSWTASRGWNDQPPFAVKDSSPIGLQRKLVETQHLRDIISSGGVAGGPSGSAQNKQQQPDAKALLVRQAETRAESLTAAKSIAASVAQTPKHDAARTAVQNLRDENIFAAPRAARIDSSDAGDLIAADAGIPVHGGLVVHEGVPPWLSPADTAGGFHGSGVAYPSPAPVVDGLGSDSDSDPIATIRRLANQYRSKHSSPTATMGDSHDAPSEFGTRAAASIR
jgi:hypothetical protein